MHKQIIKFALTVSLLAVAIMPARASEWRFEGVERVVAVADVHGANEAMVDAMKAAAVVDDELAWVAGTTHLVIVGDLLDRGPDSRASMDLLMRLETEAEAAGGKVHVLIGNHEAMNLIGDMRYVSSSEYAAFAGEETVEDRERWFAAWSEKRADPNQNLEGREVVFRQKYPPGFFAHRREFASDGKYGRWLLSKPLVVVINETAFVHGGLSPMVGEIGLEGVNGRLRGDIVQYVKQVERLYEIGVLLPTDAFYDHPAILSRFMPGLDTTSEIMRAVSAVKSLNGSDVHSIEGPLWYRGNVHCSELIEADKLTAALERIGANRVVIGHTPTPGRKVLERLDGRVIEIDTGMLNNYYGGSANALVIDAAGISVVNQDMSETTPLPHPRRVGARPAGSMTHQQIEAVLANGDVVSRRKDETGRDIVTVTDGVYTLESTFAKRSGRGFYPEVAAYRLDRMISLDMVPVAVVREVDGDDGSLQFLPKNSINEIRRQEEGSGGGAWCPVPEQWDAMFVFDVLIYNEGRTGLNLHYNLDVWQIMLTGHTRAFSTRKGVPQRLESVPFTVNQAWRDAMATLNEESLTESLGDVLDRKRIRALVARAEALAERQPPP